MSKKERELIRTIFIHHSTGADLVKHGRIRELLRQSDPCIEFWDYGYDPESVRGIRVLTAPFQRHIYGLRDGNGTLLPQSFHIPDHNTDPDGLARIFQQKATDPPANALSHLLEFDVVLFKSCFPITAIRNEQQLTRYKNYYRQIRETIAKYPQILFLPMTPPPLRMSMSRRNWAVRARRFASWMMSADFHRELANLKPFDLFDVLATPEQAAQPNVLRPEYCRFFVLDSHPNARAHSTVAPQLVEHIVEYEHNFDELRQVR